MNSRQHKNMGNAPSVSNADRSGGKITVEVASDDRFTKLQVDGSDTIAQIRREALAEMGILAPNPDQYLVIGAGRRRIDPGRTIDELVAEGERLAFRFLRPPVFGTDAEAS